MEITFNKQIQNISLQVGDIAYYVNNPTTGFASDPIKIGEITQVKPFSIIIAAPVITQPAPPASTIPTQDDFIMFVKNTAVNNSSLLGYYAEIKLSNESTRKAELFALGSEITQSSK
jgi:hypothetical protein